MNFFGMFKKRSGKNELMDDFTISSHDLRKNLDELERYNLWLGGKSVLLSALMQIRRKHIRDFAENKIVIADLGCGGGDLLRAVHAWSQAQNIKVELIGIDANPFMIQYATEKSQSFPDIHYKTLNIFSDEVRQMRFDIVCLNSVCHHFDDASLIQLLQQLTQQTRLAIIINDLQRHWMSYFVTKWITHLFSFSHLAKHDGSLSVLRAFSKQEIINLMKQAHIQHYEIRWAWAFRWAIIVWL